MSDTNEQRRQFLKTSVGAAAVAIAPGMLMFDMAHGEYRAGFEQSALGHADRHRKLCRRCDECVKACNKENGLVRRIEPDRFAMDTQGRTQGHAHRPAALALPMMCQHCEEPPCVDVCPTGASFKRADGIVLVDKHLCIGCRYCMMACPYKARSFVHEPLHDQKPDVPRGKGTVESCTMCVQRVDTGTATRLCRGMPEQVHPVRQSQRPGQRDCQENPHGGIHSDTRRSGTGYRHSLPGSVNIMANHSPLRFKTRLLLRIAGCGRAGCDDGVVCGSHDGGTRPYHHRNE